MSTLADRPAVPALRISQPSYHGPLDLLLYLVRKHEVDIREVSLAKVADEFLDAIRNLQTWDVEWAGDFLVTAASLMELKSKALLPVESAEGDLRESPMKNELVKQLLEYRKYKDAARALEESADRHATRIARVPGDEPTAAQPVPVKPVELWDLVAAFARLMRETHATQATTIQVDDTPQHVYEERILERLRTAGPLEFRDVFEPPFTKARLIGYFLALLELIKSRRVDCEQLECFGSIRLSIRVETEAALETA